jgi:hypothetical protein
MKEQKEPSTSRRVNVLSKLRALLGTSGEGDWTKSDAHLLLLGKFAHPQEQGAIAGDEWEAVLGQPVQKTIRRFVEDGALVAAGLAGSMEAKFKVSDLRGLLQQRNLPVSGRKADLIARLVQADPEGMKKATTGLTVL